MSNQNENADSKQEAREENRETLKEQDRDSLIRDSKFLVDAADGGMLEVQLGELAQKNASSADVKKFGAMMVKDHSKANDKLKELAARKRMTVPTALSDEHQRKYNDFAEKTGRDFDSTYIDFMISDHKDDIKMFQRQVNNGNEADIKQWAATTLGHLQHHLNEAEALEKKIDQARNR